MVKEDVQMINKPWVKWKDIQHNSSLGKWKPKKSIKRAPVTKGKNTCWHGCGETGTGTLVHRWRECTTEPLLCTTAQWLLRESELGLPPLGAWPEEPKAESQRDTCTPTSSAAKTWKWPKCLPAGEPAVVHAPGEASLALKGRTSWHVLQRRRALRTPRWMKWASRENTSTAHTRHLEESNSQRQKVGQWLLGAGGMGGCCLMGTEFQFRKIQQALGRDGGWLRNSVNELNTTELPT